MIIYKTVTKMFGINKENLLLKFVNLCNSFGQKCFCVFWILSFYLN